MSEHQLQTWTERARDQKRIEALEAELARARFMAGKAEAEARRIAGAYTDALEALARAQEWRWAAVLAVLLGSMLAVIALRVMGL